MNLECWGARASDERRIFLSEALFGGTPADPFLEDVREGEDTFEADGAGDDLDFVVGDGEEMAGALHAEEGEVLHGAAAELFAAHAAEVFLADASECGEVGETPVACGVFLDFVPDAPEAVVGLFGLGEAEDVLVDEFGPVVEHGCAVDAGGFGVEALDGHAEGEWIVGSGDG
jgi:hypothetical protein